MSGSAIAMMVIMCGFVWGGFVVFLTVAVKSEGKKQRDGANGAGS